MTSEMTLARTMPAGEFKAKCLKLMDEVNATGVTIIITKRGTPVCRLVPVEYGGRNISGILPAFAGFCDDPAETVVGAEDVQLLEANWDVGPWRSPAGGA